MPESENSIFNELTLPDLIAIGEEHCSRGCTLKEAEQKNLISLLTAYAEEILECGQIVHLGSVTLRKTLQGDAIVSLLST